MAKYLNREVTIVGYDNPAARRVTVEHKDGTREVVNLSQLVLKQDELDAFLKQEGSQYESLVEKEEAEVQV